MREQRTQQNRNCVAPTCQIGAHEYARLYGKRQKQLDAVISFADAGQRKRLFRVLCILTVKWATGDVPEECEFLFNAQLMFLKKEKDPTTKQIFLAMMSGLGL